MNLRNGSRLAGDLKLPVLLGRHDDARHHLHRFDRIRARGRLAPTASPHPMPSKIALATSDASARVGREFVVIDSSICVAVMANRPQRLARAACFFCTIGTASGGSSTPRSPRATITPSLTSRISSRSSIACGFSSLAIDVDLVAAEVVQQRAQVDDVAAAADERRGDVVELLLDGEPRRPRDPSP